MMAAKNTRLARRLAREYHRMTGCEFPGGEGNAFIFRHRPKLLWRNRGAWVWWLAPVCRTLPDGSKAVPLPFGSVAPATEAVKKPDFWIETED